MYYEESLSLISSNPLDKNSIESLDRVIAQTYSVGGKGNIELTLLTRRANLEVGQVRNLMLLFERAGVVQSYKSVMCLCNSDYDPADGKCGYCDRSIQDAMPSGLTVYNILKQPKKPTYDPLNQPLNPEVFISYRRDDTEQLATDIYYLVKNRGIPVFLDSGEIPVGSSAERVFLKAASDARYFISLISEHYFESNYCKKEFAHSARSARRIIRVNIDPVPTAPPDMSWVDAPNWITHKGKSDGIDPQLVVSILSAIQTPISAPKADLRIEACTFLMEQLSIGEMTTLWNRLNWMSSFLPLNSKAQMIQQIKQEVTSSRLADLCNALAP